MKAKDIAEAQLLTDYTPNEIARIDTIYVVLSVDGNGEGICALNGMPMIFAGARLLAKVDDIIAAVAAQTPKGINLRLVQFERGKVLTEIKR